PPGKQPREFAVAPRHQAGDVLRVHQVGGELDHVVERGALGGQRRAEVLERQRALLVEVGRGLAVAPHPDLAGDEQKLRRLDPRDVRVGAERLAQAVRVETFDLGHRYSNPATMRRSRTAPSPSAFSASWYPGLLYAAIAFSTLGNSETTMRSFSPAS